MTVDASGWPPGLADGESICVQGVCLTLRTEAGQAGFLSFDVVKETLSRTTLGGLGAGGRVNLERSARAETLLGGHIVQGHVDAIGEVVSVSDGTDDWRVRIKPDPAAMEFIVPKGSITVDGVSLTVAGTGPGWFEVVFIPVTLARTTLGGLVPGARCNIETDILSRTIVHWMRNYSALVRDRGPQSPR